MAETGPGIAIEFTPRAVQNNFCNRFGDARYPKPGPSRGFFLSLLMCFPLACMLWAALIYGAVRLAR